MTIESESIGLTTNFSKKIDAAEHVSIYASIATSTSFADGQAAYVFKQSNTPIMEYEFKKGEPAGLYNLRVYWKSDEFDANDLEVHIYGDGVQVASLIDSSGGNFQTIGSNFIFMFYPSVEYKLVITTGENSDKSTVWVDYVQLDQIYACGTVGSLMYVYGDDGPAVEVIDRGTASVAGWGGATADTAVTFNLEYSTPPQIELSCGNHLYNPSWHSKTTTGFTIRVVGMNLSTFSDTVEVDWVAHGSIVPPFKPKNHDYGTP